MSQSNLNQVTDAETADSHLRGLYRVGGMTGLIIAVFLVCEIIMFAVWPQPSTVTGYFTLFRSNWLIGLLDLDLLGMVAYVLFVPVILALYVALRRANEAIMAIATALFYVGISVFFATNTVSPCSPSATNTLPRRRTRKGPFSWRRGSRCSRPSMSVRSK
jgi:hypothetical protein